MFNFVLHKFTQYCHNFVGLIIASFKFFTKLEGTQFGLGSTFKFYMN